MLSRIFAFTLLFSVSAFAADECSPIVIAPESISDLSLVSARLNVQCPNQLNVSEFCAAVSAPLIETNPSHVSVRYQYQSMMFTAACIQRTDSPEVIRGKVQNFWNRYHDSLSCNQLNFNPRNGNILKLAVARQSNRFIEDALSSWQLSLNHIDTVDNGTVLDYIAQRRTAAGPNSSFGRALKRYYDRFVVAGAKHRRDL